MITARNRAKGLWESPKLNHASFFSLLGGARTAVQFLTSVPTRIFVYSHFSQSKSFVYFSISQSKPESRKARNSNQGRTGALVPLLFTPIPHRKTKWSKTGSGTGFCRLATKSSIQKITQQQSGTGRSVYDYFAFDPPIHDHIVGKAEAAANPAFSRPRLRAQNYAKMHM